MTWRMGPRAIATCCLAFLIGAACLAARASANETLSYSYDALGRLVKVARAGTVNNGATECYGYDPASNRSNVTTSSTSDCTPLTQPSFSINDASATEGGTLTFTVTRAGPTTGSYTVNYSTAPNTATAATDYNSGSGTLTFASGVTSQTIQVTTIQDTQVEGNETFYVNLSGASGGATITDSQAVGTIIDDDAPSFSISDSSATEGGTITFVVTRSAPTAGSYTVNYATANNSATAGSDYTAKSGTLTFAPGVTTQTIPVTTLTDTLAEPNETFYVNLASPSGGATISDAQGIGTIIDAPPCNSVTFSTANAGSVTEGGTLTFTVTKGGTATGSCSVNYATQDNTATAGSDYTAVSGTLTFAVADSSKTITVQTIDDSVVENTEGFNMNLTSPTGGATLGQYVGSASILDNDTGNHPPVTTADSLTVSACGSGTVNVVANDSDPDGDAITLVSVSGGTKGDATVASTTSVKYSAFTSSGTDTVTYTVQDTHGATANGTLFVTISGGQCMAPPP